jgi:ADP-ribose pyrophosphatase YjhB (NUDIX family)
LLCLRDIDPRAGCWTLPAGFHENGETVAHGAARETSEEANARVQNLELYTVFSLPHISQIYMFFRADLTDLEFSAGEETRDVGLYRESDIPWDELAFPVITRTLEHYYAQREADAFSMLYEEIDFKRR